MMRCVTGREKIIIESDYYLMCARSYCDFSASLQGSTVDGDEDDEIAIARLSYLVFQRVRGIQSER